MFGIATRYLKDKRNILVGFCIGAIGLIEMYVALFPSIQNQAENLNKMLDSFPKGFMEAFGMNSANLIFSQLESYMASEYFSFFWPIFTVILAISLANAICVSEIENGTIEFTLSQPISRKKILFSRYLTGCLSLLIFMVVSVYGIMAVGLIHGIKIQTINYINVFWMGMLCSLAIFSIATFFSVLFSEKSKSTLATSLILLIMYAGNIVSNLSANLDKVKYVSFFYYFDTSSIFGMNKIPKGAPIVFTVTIIVFLLLSLFRFNKREIEV